MERMVQIPHCRGSVDTPHLFCPGVPFTLVSSNPPPSLCAG